MGYRELAKTLYILQCEKIIGNSEKIEPETHNYASLAG
jgi:hypothetical protein